MRKPIGWEEPWDHSVGLTLVEGKVGSEQDSEDRASDHDVRLMTS